MALHTQNASARIAKLTELTRDELANLRRHWFGSIYEIADIEYQRETWLTRRTEVRTGPMLSFVAHIPVPISSNPRENAGNRKGRQ
jgi:hypothetical protein